MKTTEVLFKSRNGRLWGERMPCIAIGASNTAWRRKIPELSETISFDEIWHATEEENIQWVVARH